MGDPPVSTVSRRYDVIVIGGGINGTGIARDAADRGLRVLLVEKNDLGAGTTAYSSRLVHGGLRYLEHMEFDLVLESLHERAILLQTAPHLIRPQPLVIPIYNYQKRSRWWIEAGMQLYDLLSRLAGEHQLPGTHRMYRRDSFLRKAAPVNPEGLKGGFKYFDAQCLLPERLCVENALAARQRKATILNHTEVTDIITEQDAVVGIRTRDTFSGQASEHYAHAVVNAAGPWVDTVLQKARPTVPRQIGGTKGSHIVVHRFAGGPHRAIYVEARRDGRPFFIIPWLEKYYLIGTTDIPYDGNLDRIVPSEEEIHYLISETNSVLPQARLQRESVLYSYAGVRPLPYAPGKKPGEITRKHILHDHKKDGLRNLFSVIGGKITTYRNLAREMVNLLDQRYDLDASNCNTDRTPLPGGQGIENIHGYLNEHVSAAARTYKISPDVITHLIQRYGSNYDDVLDIARQQPQWKARLSDTTCDIVAEVVYAYRNEWARTSADVLLRRTTLGFEEDTGLSVLEPVSRLLGELQGWDEARIQQDMAQYRDYVFSVMRPGER